MTTRTVHLASAYAAFAILADSPLPVKFIPFRERIEIETHDPIMEGQATTLRYVNPPAIARPSLGPRPVALELTERILCDVVPPFAGKHLQLQQDTPGSFRPVLLIGQEDACSCPGRTLPPWPEGACRQHHHTERECRCVTFPADSPVLYRP
jgi:hypothetical protein